jgi:TonB family protein
VLLVFLACSPLRCQESDLARKLKEDLTGKVWIVKNSLQDDSLDFDAAGAPRKKYHPGSWTTAEVSVTSVKQSGDTIEISGDRVFESTDEHGNLVHRYPPQHRRVRIRIHPPGNTTAALSAADLEAALFAVVRTAADAQQFPPYWRAFFDGRVATDIAPDGKRGSYLKSTKSGAAGTQVESLPYGDPVYTVGSNVKPPKPTYTPEPEYSETARHSKFQGITVIAMVVTAAGTVADPQVIRPLGFGLDEQAIAAVQQWKFRPATLDGKPVAALISVEVSFRLF